jgi:hypothetical protein
MIDQREWVFASAASGETFQHALLRERVMFRLQIASRDRGPGRQIVERIASGATAGRPEEQLYRRYFARERIEMTSEIRQCGVVDGLEQRQQGLADRAPFGPHAAQQQFLAFLVGPPEFEVEEHWNQDEDDGKKRYLRRERRYPAAASPCFSLPRSSGIRNWRNFRYGRNRGRHHGTSCGYAS